MTYDWEGNRRFGVALAMMRHRLTWFIQLRVKWPKEGDELPAYTILYG